MNAKETAEHLLKYVPSDHDCFSWPTDSCGYDQHIRFVRHRNKNWHGGNANDWKQFITDYANSLLKPQPANGE